MEDKLYTAREINEYMGYPNKSKQNDNYKQFVTRCHNAGLEIELVNNKRGTAYLYKIIKDDMHWQNERWIEYYLYPQWEVSDQGRVRAKDTKKLIGHKDDKGYIVSTSSEANGTNKRHLLHRAIYFSFHPEDQDDSDLYVIDHINGKRDDNRLINLRKLTSRQNCDAREENNTPIQELTAKIIQKYGYDNARAVLEKILEKGLTF